MLLFLESAANLVCLFATRSPLGLAFGVFLLIVFFFFGIVFG